MGPHMRAESERAVSGYQPGSPRQRLISTLLSASVIVLALLIAIYQTQFAPRLAKKNNPVTFDVAGDHTKNGAKAEQKHKQSQRRKTDKPREEQVRVQAPIPPVEKPVPQEKQAFSFIKLSHADMAASDISGMKRSGTDGGASSGATYGPGEGPGGATLYNADWFQRPTDAQIGGYLPANAPPEGWGMIACQTMPHNKVDNCEILGESPRGSGLGRAVLNASWQFQVLPPRINGKPQLGAWVRIRIDYGVRKAAG